MAIGHPCRPHSFFSGARWLATGSRRCAGSTGVHTGCSVATRPGTRRRRGTVSKRPWANRVRNRTSPRMLPMNGSTTRASLFGASRPAVLWFEQLLLSVGARVDLWASGGSLHSYLRHASEYCAINCTKSGVTGAPFDSMLVISVCAHGGRRPRIRCGLYCAHHLANFRT